jgi:hypothetical protein
MIWISEISFFFFYISRCGVDDCDTFLGKGFFCVRFPCVMGHFQYAVGHSYIGRFIFLTVGFFVFTGRFMGSGPLL